MRKLILLGVFILAAGTFFTGINWGLPSRESDEFLFGNKTPWTGQQIMDLAGAWDNSGTRGADIAMHPLDLQSRNRPIVLNDTDTKRAEIVRRYRLYSNQPDEMITFRSLSRMKPGRLDLDPRMYQYGGLWIYPIGGLLKIASAFGLVTLRSDLAFYLDHPQAFGRFYLVARMYAAMWGLIGVAVVYALAREWTGEYLAGIAAAGMYAAMPVVINLAHEAKPHLPGAVLVMLTIWAAMRYVRTGLSRWWIAAGIAAGAAMGMVLTGYVAFAVLPVMTLLRPISWKDRAKIAVSSGLIGIAIFALTNPYLPFNLLLHREVLHSNVGNYGTFYKPAISLSGLVSALHFLLLGTSVGPSVLGVMALAVFVRWRLGSGLLLAAPAIVVLIQFLLLADGKMAEYARFALLPDIVAVILTAALIARLGFKPREKGLAATCVVAATLFVGVRYDINFIADGWPDSTRRLNSKEIEKSKRHGEILSVWSEPAPYCLPPVDLFDWKIVLMPRGTGGDCLSVRPVDEDPGSFLHPLRPASPMSWANKPFELIKPRGD